MTPPDDRSPPRRPMFFPVVIATVFLTIIAMTAGYLLGERHRERLRAQGSVQTRTPDVVPETTPSAAAPPAARMCPDETRKTAAGLGLSADLTQVLRIATENGTTVWICQDGAGGLYYQGKTGGVDAPLVEKKNGLFLSDVKNGNSRGEYEARADNGNRIVVTRDRLEVHFADGRPAQINNVTEAE